MACKQFKFKVGDMVIGNDPYRYAYTKKGWIGEVKKVHSDGRIDVYGKSGTRDCHMTYTYLEPQYFDLYAESKSNKIVITHDGKTTTATLYRENGTKEVATAKCCPEDTFDFNVGAKLAMERLMKKVEPVEEWRVVDRKPRPGDYIRITDPEYSFDKKGDILRLDGIHSCVNLPYIYQKNHPNSTSDVHPNFDWSYPDRVFEVVEKVTAIEPKKPEPPKYFTGKAICIREGIRWWTKGKIYEFVDGRTTDDEGDFRRYTCNEYNFKQIFLPIVE